jgi:hypothetical protein
MRSLGAEISRSHVFGRKAGKRDRLSSLSAGHYFSIKTIKVRKSQNNQAEVCSTEVNQVQNAEGKRRWAQCVAVIVQCDWRSSGYRSDWAREAWFRLSYRMESGNPAISFKIKLRIMIAPTATNDKTGLTLASTVSSPPHRPVAETINGTRAHGDPAGAGSA